MEVLRKIAFTGVVAGALAPMSLAQTAPAPAPAAAASPVAGDWKAVVQRDNGPIHIVLHVVADNTGALSATIDAIEMQAEGVVASNVAFKSPKLSFDVDQAPGSYAGTLNKDGTEIDGTWTPDNGQAAAMNFTRDTGAPSGAAAPAPAGTAPAPPAQPSASPQP